MAAGSRHTKGHAILCTVLMASITGCGSGVYLSSVTSSASAGIQTFNVTSFGATGNGIADDAPAIQRALSAAASGGGQVLFPCGTFLLKSVPGAAPSARSILYINDAANVQVLGHGSCTHISTTLANKSVLEFQGSTQITVQALWMTALNTPYIETYGMDGGSAVRFTGVTGGSINNVQVDGASAGALYLTAGTSGISVTNNNVHDTYASAIWEDDCGAASATSCAPSKPPSDNIYDSNTLTNVSMNGGGAISVDDGNGTSNAIIRNNVVSWTKAALANDLQIHCIGINNASSVSALNNSCDGTPWDAIALTTGGGGMSSNVLIQGNTISNSGTSAMSGSGIVVYDAPQGLGISAFTITANTIQIAGQDGIRAYAASAVGNVKQGQIIGNTISLVDQLSPGSRFGVDVEFSSNIDVQNNAITCTPSCIAAGVRVNSSIQMSPAQISNQVSDILGVPLLIQ